MFDIIFLKKTGQIVRTGYFNGTLNLAEDEDSLSFDSWVEFQSKAVNVKKRILVDATEKNTFSLRGELGPAVTEAHDFGTRLQSIATWSAVLTRRNELLNQSDYMMMPDYPISTEYREKLAAYRQALRDLTKQENPEAIVWPEFPEK
jgi:hypothetical protein